MKKASMFYGAENFVSGSFVRIKKRVFSLLDDS